MAKPYRRKDSKFWWIAPMIDGKQRPQSSETTDYAAALDRLHKIQGDIASGEAKVPGRRLHDFRRTAVRNLLNAGVPLPDIMNMVGFKTMSMLIRYSITSDADISRAGDLMEKSGRKQLPITTVSGSPARCLQIQRYYSASRNV